MDRDETPLRYSACHRQRPCPICGRGSPCQATDDGHVECAERSRSGKSLPAPRGWTLQGEVDGAIPGAEYAPTGGPREPRTWAGAKEENRERNIRKAREEWARAARSGRDHPRLLAYLKHRGIDVAALPGGRAPAELAYLADCFEAWIAEERRELRAPAMVARLVELRHREGEGRKVSLQQTGLHRVYLAADSDGKRPDEDGDPKKMLGACGGRMVVLREGLAEGVVLIAEGIETGLACLQATGLATWVGLSANFLDKLARNLPAALFTPRDGRPAAVHTVVFAADLNKTLLGAKAKANKVNDLRDELRGLDWATAESIAGKPTGERAAWHAMYVLINRFPGIQVVVRAPSAAACPQLVRVEDDREVPVEGKGVDWLDVLNAAGPAAVREGLVGGLDLEANARASVSLHATAVPPTPEVAVPLGGGGAGARSWGRGGGPDDDDPTAGLMWYEDGYDVPCISPGAQDRARLFLLQKCLMEGARRWRLLRWAGKFFWYDAGRWHDLGEKDRVFGMVGDWLSRFNTARYLKDSTEVERLHPTQRMVEEILRFLAAETYVDIEAMPAWLPPSLDEAGRPMWGTAVHRFAEYRPTGVGNPGDWLVYANGRLNANDLVAGRVNLLPATPDLFTFAVRPYKLDVAMLERVLREGFTDRIAKEVCPNFWRWLTEATDSDEGRMQSLQRIVGDASGAWRDIEKIILLQGAKRTGKDLLMDAISASLGEKSIASTSFFALGDRFGLAPLVGRSVILMPDAHVADFQNNTAVLEQLKIISGNGRSQVRDLYTKADPNVKLRGRIIIACNDVPDKLADNSGAFASRLLVWPMTKSFYGREDGRLKEGVALEGPGINLWALRGLVDLRRMARPCLEAPARGQEIQREIERISSPLTAFLQDCCELGEDHSVAFGTIYRLYAQWCEIFDHKRVGKNKYTAKLRPLVAGLQEDDPRYEMRNGVEVYVPRTLWGLTLKTPDGMPEEMNEHSGGTSTPWGKPPGEKAASPARPDQIDQLPPY